MANGECGSGCPCGLGEHSHFLQLLPCFFPPAPSLISEYVVEEVKEGGFVSTGIYTFLHDCTFLARSLSSRAEAGEVVLLGIKRQKNTRRQETTQRSTNCLDIKSLFRVVASRCSNHALAP